MDDVLAEVMKEDVLPDSREPAGTADELPGSVIRRGGSVTRRAGTSPCGHSLELLAGVLAAEEPAVRVARPVADVTWGLS